MSLTVIHLTILFGGIMLKAEIIAVGTELLLGQTVNTNATFLSEELASLGFEVYYHSVVGDNEARLLNLLALADTRSELIVLCGGLGPTQDDITKEVLAKHLNQPLEANEMALKKIVHHLTRLGRPITENNRKQSQNIKGGIPIQNPNGLALGTLYTVKNRSYLVLPGPPVELEPMFLKEVTPLLKKILPQEWVLDSRVLRFYGIGEAQLVTEIEELITHQMNPTIAAYAKSNEVTLRVTAKANTHEKAKELLDQAEKDIQKIVGKYFYGYGDNHSLEAETVGLLKKYHQTVTSAESLTAGLFQETLAKVPGVSQCFPGGFVTYSKEAKAQLLDISLDQLNQVGVVSKECACLMAEQSRLKLGTDYSISFTGVAGPEELEGKSAGTVWIGVSSKKSGTTAYLYQFNRDREYIRHSALMAGLNLLRQQILMEH